MINQEMETMVNKLLLFSLIFLLVITPVMAKGMIDLEPKQIDKKQILDKEYIVKESGTYFKDLKQDNPIVWIDKKVGDIYHVDSIKDFNKEENESVTLEFYYKIQPDYIAHYTHSGKFDRYYFPTQWDWENDCEGEECSGGWVTIEVQNIEEGTGSSTFPIGTTGPTWANDGQFYGEFDGDSSYVEAENSNGEIYNNTNFTISLWLNKKGLTGDTQFAFSHPETAGDGNRIYISFSSGNNDLDLKVGSIQSSNNFDVGTNEWHFITLTSSFNVSYKGYVDGTNVTGNVLSTAGTDVLRDIFIGIRNTADQYFNGSIDEVLIYNRSLSQAEVTALYNNYTLLSTGPQRTSTPSTNGLVLDINFDDFSVGDNSGQANHGTNTNVSFGEVADNEISLVKDVDYTVGTSTFTIINHNYAWTGINVSYDYTTDANSVTSTIAHLIEVFVALGILSITLLIINHYRKEFE
mgnify:CR=1 FL=1|tara:strand:+ start:4088 stop:5479 length:1392 start_codon:yes stop_codon:yes gene_type:complete